MTWLFWFSFFVFCLFFFDVISVSVSVFAAAHKDQVQPRLPARPRVRRHRPVDSKYVHRAVPTAAGHLRAFLKEGQERQGVFFRPFFPFLLPMIIPFSCFLFFSFFSASCSNYRILCSNIQARAVSLFCQVLAGAGATVWLSQPSWLMVPVPPEHRLWDIYRNDH